MKLFNCEPGTLYSAPFSNKVKKMINLRILENLGHNSIKVQCLNCNAIDTYKKNELEEGTVYICKHCGKNAVYENSFCRLSIVKIINRDTTPIAACKCLDCGKTSNYKLEDLMLGKIYSCKHCMGGIYTGKKLGRLEVIKLAQASNGIWGVKIECSKCNKTQVFVLDKFINALRQGQDINKVFKCDCNNTQVVNKSNGTQQTQQKQQKQQKQHAQKVKLPQENDNFTDIRESNKYPGFAFAKCRNCGVEKQYKIQYIIDNEPCDICWGYGLGDEIAHRNIDDKEIERITLSENGKNQVVKMRRRYELSVSNNSLIKSEFDEARENKKKYKPNIYCKCNNCNSELLYSIDDINAGDVKYCKACEFKILIGSIIGSKTLSNSQEILRVYSSDNVTQIDTKCNTCGVKITTLKTEYISSVTPSCPVCTFKRIYKNFDNIVGNIFGVDGISVVDGYNRVGKYLVLSEKYIEGKYRIKAQCVECGTLIERNFAEKDGFINEYSNKECINCETLLVGTKNYINNNNWIGYIKNCRIIEDVFMEDQIKKANVKCMFCDSVSKVPLTVFLYSDYCVCEHCKDRQIVIKCPSCGEVHKNDITLGQLYSTNNRAKIKCPVTKNDVSISMFRLRNEEESKMDFLLSKCAELADVEIVPGTSGLVKSVSKYYEGTDGEKYYTCYCKEHNKFMTLKQNEMETYDHVYCSDTRMFGYM